MARVQLLAKADSHGMTQDLVYLRTGVADDREGLAVFDLALSYATLVREDHDIRGLDDGGHLLTDL